MELDLSGKKEMTDLQKAWIAQEPKYKYFALISEATKGFTIPSEELEAIKGMRSLLDSVMAEIPFSNLNGMDLETYNEICTLPFEKMEWGVVQKCCSLMLGIQPKIYYDSVEEFDAFKKIKCCVHSKEEAKKFCTICDGNGLNVGELKPNETKLKILFYNHIVCKISSLNSFISSSIDEMKTKTLESIWWKLTDHERFSINIEIKKRNK